MASARGIEALDPRNKGPGASRRRLMLKLTNHVPKIVQKCFPCEDVLDHCQYVAAKTLKGT